MKKLVVTVTFMLLLSAFPVMAEPMPDTAWVRVIGDSQHLEECYCVRQTRDGGYILVGRQSLPTQGAYSDLLLVKTNASGSPVWARAYDIGINGHVRGKSVEQTPDGGYIIAGWADNQYGNQDGYVLKTDGNGNIVWHRLYGGGGDDEFEAVALTADGGYIVAGSTDSTTYGDTGAYIARLGTNGTPVWQYYYGGEGNEYANSVCTMADGNFAFCGSTSSEDYFDIYDTGVYLGKLATNGNIIWHGALDFSEWGDESAESVGTTSDGGLIVAGTFEQGADPGCAFLLKTNGSGTVLWANGYNWGGSEVFSSVMQTSDGGYIACGRTNSQGSGSYDVLIFNMDASGQPLWYMTFGGSDYDAAYSVRQTADNGFIIGGKENGLGGQVGTGMYLIKLSPPADFAIDLNLNKYIFRAGDTFDLTLSMRNNSGHAQNVNIYVLLDVYGAYFFWPSWRSDTIDFDARTLPDGYDQVESILNFTWPSGAGQADGLLFWAALLSPNNELLCDLDSVEFGYSS